MSDEEDTEEGLEFVKSLSTTSFSVYGDVNQFYDLPHYFFFAGLSHKSLWEKRVLWTGDWISIAGDPYPVIFLMRRRKEPDKVGGWVACNSAAQWWVTVETPEHQVCVYPVKAIQGVYDCPNGPPWTATAVNNFVKNLINNFVLIFVCVGLITEL